jgi:Tfp pilus assembly protein PilF
VHVSVLRDSAFARKKGHELSAMTSRHLLIALSLIVLTIVVFAPIGGYGFINYDDGAYVIENVHVIGGLSSQNISWAFSFESCGATSNWHPLTWLSLMADVTLFGVNPSRHHLVNLALHVVNVLLLFAILIRMTQAIGQSAFVAAIFAIHPLHVESVAWISERKDVLSTVFVLLTILTWLQYVRAKQQRWHIVSLCCFILSLLSKQMYVTLPFLLLLLDYWPLQRLTSTANDREVANGVFQQILRLTTEKLLYLLIAAVFCVIAFVGQKHGGAVGTFEDFPFVQRCLNAVVTYVVYLWQTIWPTNLAVFYPYPQHTQWLLAIMAGIILVAITSCVLKFRFRHPYLIVGWLWYTGTLVPVIGLVQIGQQRMADRYMYFPMIGLLVGSTCWLATWAADQPRRIKSLQCIALIIIIVMSCVCRVQTTHWKNSVTLFTHAADVAESSLAYTKLGYERAQVARFSAAIILFQRALRLDPNYVAAHSSLGNTYLAEGNPQRAIQHFQKVIKLDPDHAEAHYNLGIIFSGLGQLAGAVKHYELALLVDPDNAQVHVNLGVAFLRLKENPKAFGHLKQAIEIEPELPEAHFNLASLLVSVERESEAIIHFQKGLESRPNVKEVHRELARLYLKQGSSRLAKKHRQLADGNAGTQLQAD